MIARNSSGEEADVLLVYNAGCLVLSLVGNIGVIFVICAQKKARTTPNMTMISVATADVITAVFVIPSWFVMAASDDAILPFMPFICKLHVYVWYWCKTASVYSIVAMVCDRYNRFFKPLKSPANVSGRFMFFLSFVWFFGAAYNIWEIVLNSSLHQDGYNITHTACGPSAHFQHLHGSFLIADLVVIFVLPLVVVAFFFASMFYDVLHPDERVQRPRLVGGRRRMLLSVLLFVAFYSCHLPLEISDVIAFVTGVDDHPRAPSTRYLVACSFTCGVVNAALFAASGTDLHSAVSGAAMRRRSSARRPSQESTSPALVSTDYPLPEIIFTKDNSRDTSML
jgi:hypothetical protein